MLLQASILKEFSLIQFRSLAKSIQQTLLLFVIEAVHTISDVRYSAGYSVAYVVQVSHSELIT